MSVDTSLNTVDAYVAALSKGDTQAMDHLRTDDFVLDWVHQDAYQNDPLTVEGTRTFWSIWLNAFPDRDYAVTRTIAAPDVVVTQWVFAGTHMASLDPPVFDPALAATGRTIRFRGVSVYDMDPRGSGLIQRETTYLDLATVMVELGVEL
jgi:steroid delta-isomerase-like uncharacterized protein